MAVLKALKDGLDDIGISAKKRFRNLFLAGYIELDEMTAPGTPATDKARLYCAVDGATSKLYFKDQAGTATGLLDNRAAGALTLVDSITFTPGAAAAVALVTNGASDDLTIAQTGAYDSSIHVSTTGTGADALTLTASAGGIDISGGVGGDIDIVSTGKSVNLTATEAAADQILLTASGTIAGNAIKATTTDGGIYLDANGAVNGDITIDAADVITLITPDPIVIQGGTNVISFDGTTAGTYVTNLTITDPTATRTVTIPDATGTVRLRGTATHDYAGGAVAWTLSVDEAECSFITCSNANGAVIAQLPATAPGMSYLVYDGTGQTLTFKVTGGSGGTIANGKYAMYAGHATDVVEVWEQS